jgi:hypothetical protein
VSHPIPLHPDADLAVVLDDLRQSVAAWGDEGMVSRFFRASICLMLLSILDTLIDLLADFRAGRLPPVLPALERSGKPATSGTKDQRGIEPPQAAAAGAAGASPRRSTGRLVRAPSADASSGAPAEAPIRPGVFLAPRRIRNRCPEHGPRGVAFDPSAVPRWPTEKIGHWRVQRSRVHFVTISDRSATRCPDQVRAL